MAAKLSNKRVALLVTDGFEQVELTSPQSALHGAGAKTSIVSPNDERVRGWEHTDWGETFDVDAPVASARAADFDALVLPGGVMNPDKLRCNEQATRLVREFFDQKKPVAAICHGPWTLIDAGLAKGRRLTSYHSIRTDLVNAGADWVNEEVVVDGNLITSRNPDDLEAFNNMLIEQLVQAEQPAGRA